MMLTMLRSKIHMATVTESDLEYEGSLKIDIGLMDMVRIRPFEKVLVANLENGNRFETYAIPGKRGSGEIGLNGATTYLGKVGDRLIIFTFCQVDESVVDAHKPYVLILDRNNRPKGGLKEV